MSKVIQFDVEARRKLKEGMNALARSVVVTLPDLNQMIFCPISKMGRLITASISRQRNMKTYWLQV